MQITRAKSTLELFDLAECWNEMAGDMPFLSWEWMASWWQHYGADLDPYVLVVRDDAEEVVGIAPFCLHHSKVGANVIKFIGTGSAQSYYLRLLTRPNCERPVAASLARWLDAESRSWSESIGFSNRWDSCLLSGAVAGEESLACLVQAIEDQKSRVSHRRTSACWTIQLPIEWQGYFGRHTHWQQSQISSLESRYLTSDSMVTHVATSHDRLDAAQLAYGKLRQLNLKAGRRDQVNEPQFEDFLRTVAGQFLHKRSADWIWFEWDGQPFATAFLLRGKDRLFVYHTMVNPAFAPDAQHVVLLWSIKSAIEDGFSCLELLCGDGPVKALWKAEPRECEDLRIVSGAPSARLHHTAWLASGTVKELLKNGMSIAGLGNW